LARQERVRPFSVFFAAWLVMLHRYSGQNDLIVPFPVAGRGRYFREVCGYFVNLLPVRARIADGQSFLSFLHKVAQSIEQALEYRLYPIQVFDKGHQGEERGANLSFCTGFEWQNFNGFESHTPPLVAPSGPTGEIWNVSEDMQWER